MRCLKVHKIWTISWISSAIIWNLLWCRRPVTIRTTASNAQKRLRKSRRKRHCWIRETTQTPNSNWRSTCQEPSKITTWNLWVIGRCKGVPLGNSGSTRRRPTSISRRGSLAAVSRSRISLAALSKRIETSWKSRWHNRHKAILIPRIYTWRQSQDRKQNKIKAVIFKAVHSLWARMAAPCVKNASISWAIKVSWNHLQTLRRSLLWARLATGWKFVLHRRAT